MAAVKKSRGELKTLPTGRFTADRKTLIEMEDAALKAYYAEWLSNMTGETVTEENFCADLADGVALLKIISRIDGSGVESFHEVKSARSHERAFKGRDNMVLFQDACRRLALPDTVTSAELLEGTAGKVISVLVQLEEICDEDNIMPLNTPEEDHKKSKRRSTKRRSTRRASKSETGRTQDPLADLLNKIKVLCGCGKDTVVA